MKSQAIQLSPHQRLKGAVHDTRLLGGVFIVLGAVVLWGGVFGVGPRVGLAAQVFAIVITLTLVGPGVWYFVAGAMMRQLDRRAVKISLWVAAGQVSAILVAIVIGCTGTFDLFVVPAVVACFFVPALIALVFALIGGKRAMNQISPEGHGFEPMPVKVIALKSRDGTTEA